MKNDAKINKKRLSKKGAIALSVLIAVLIVLALYFSITLIKQATAQSGTHYLQFNKGLEVVKIGSDGSLALDEDVCELSTLYYGPITQTLKNEFVIKNNAGEIVAMVDDAGYIKLKGRLYKNQGSIANPSGGDFIVKNSAGTIVALFDSKGNLNITGGVTHWTSAEVGDGCCGAGRETWRSDPGSCGAECAYECFFNNGGTALGCKSDLACQNLVPPGCNLGPLASCTGSFICCCQGMSGPCRL